MHPEPDPKPASARAFALALAVLAITLSAPVATAQEHPAFTADLAEGGERSRLERLVVGSMRAAESRLSRAARLEDKAEGAGEEGDESRQRALLRGVKRHVRIAYLGLQRYREVDLEEQLGRVYRAAFEQTRAELVRAYEALIAAHRDGGNQRAAARHFASLRRLDRKAAARVERGILREGLERDRTPRARERALEREHDRGVLLRRSGRRLTGYELRWLQRRGYQPVRPPRGPRPAPRAPQPPRAPRSIPGSR